MDDRFSQSLATIEQKLEEGLQTLINSQKKCSLGQEFGNQFPNPTYEPYNQPSFQTFQPLSPPHKPCYEPPSPSYNPYFEPIQPLRLQLYNPSPQPYELHQQDHSPSYLPTSNSSFIPYDHNFEPTFHQPQPVCEPSFPPQPITSQPSELDILPSSYNLDDLTNALTRKYDTLKEKYLVLLMQGTTESSKEMEDIDEFFKAYYDHMLWMKTKGEDGNPWPKDLQESEREVQDQASNVNPHVDSPQAPIPPFTTTTQCSKVKQVCSQLPDESSNTPGNISPILEESNSHLITAISIEALSNASEDDVDEDIIVESSHMFENVNAHLNASSGTLVRDDACTVTTSLCDDHASFPSTRHDVIGFNETLSCSCDNDVICMLCIDKKNDNLMACHEKNFGEVHDSFDGTSSAEIDEHEFLEDLPLVKDSESLTDKIANENESSSDCKDVVLCSNNSKFLTSTLQAQQNSENFTVFLVPTEGNHIDFLGCDSYLESFVPKIFSFHSISLHICILGIDTAVGPMFILQNHTKQGCGYKTCASKPSPIDQEPPPRKSNVGGVVIKNFMFLIRDENFSYKSLRRFKLKRRRQTPGSSSVSVVISWL